MWVIYDGKINYNYDDRMYYRKMLNSVDAIFDRIKAINDCNGICTNKSGVGLLSQDEIDGVLNIRYSVAGCPKEQVTVDVEKSVLVVKANGIVLSRLILKDYYLDSITAEYEDGLLSIKVRKIQSPQFIDMKIEVQ